MSGTGFFFCAVWGDKPCGEDVGGERGGRTELGPAVRAGRGEPFVAVLQSGGRERGEPGADARDRRGAHQVSILRCPADALAPAPRWPGCGCEPPAPADAGDVADPWAIANPPCGA